MERLEDELRERGISGASNVPEQSVPGVSGSGGVRSFSRRLCIEDLLNVRELSLFRILGLDVD